MKLIGITYKNTSIDDGGTFRSLPKVLQQFLQQVNGIIAYKGGIHFRGCCVEPTWHSIQEAWNGKLAFWKNYSDILDIDIPFAQDCMGDQFLLRGEKVIKLHSETAQVEFLNIDFIGFLDEIEKDPVTFLGMHPIIQFEMEGKSLEPGNLLNSSPDGKIKSLTVEDQLQYLVKISKQKRSMEDDEGIKFFVG
jgi:hypothetical protein